MPGVTWKAKPCGCEVEIYAGQKREKLCDHGNVYLPEKAAAPKEHKPRRASQPKRNWDLARTKVEEERCCRICKRTDRLLEAAHVLGREHDEPMMIGDRITKTLLVHPLRVIPLCGPFPEGCHGKQHAREINVLSHLTLDEQLQAVKDAGGIEAARIRLEPVNYNAEVRELAA
jgi:hypothetical protein